MHITITTEKGSTCASVVPGSTVLSVLQDCGIPFAAPCGGNGRCGRCRVVVKDARGSRYSRACQTEVTDGMEVVLKKISGITIERGGKAGATFDRLLANYPPDGNMTAFISSGSDRTRHLFGVALDIGTTTLVCRLHDLRSGALLARAQRLNPQVRYGSDILTRIESAQSGHLEEIRDVLCDALDRMVDQVCVDTHIEYDDIAGVSLVGNTAMETIAAGLSPASMGTYPFEPPSHFGEMRDLSDGHPPIWYAPVLGGHVGGDIAAGLLATGIARTGRPHMLIDIGTNGEVVIGNSSGMMCCSTAAGPAFEGVDILYGMPALPGAISSVRLAQGRIICETIGDIAPQGICGTGLIDALVVMLELGVIDGDGRMREPVALPKDLHERVQERDGIKIFMLDPEYGICLTQKDVRALQLSKAAIYAGVMTLMHEYGADCEDVEWVGIAGGFGTNLSLSSIEAIRLLPRELVGKGELLGNVAIEGASCALLSKVARDEMLEIAKACTQVELATQEGFNAAYMNALSF